jgi:hypothetical protein
MEGSYALTKAFSDHRPSFAIGGIVYLKSDLECTTPMVINNMSETTRMVEVVWLLEGNICARYVKPAILCKLEEMKQESKGASK